MKTISHSGIAALFFAVLSCPAALVSAHQHDTALGREALLEVFAWDPKTAEITTEKVADGLYVLFGLGGNIAVSVGSDGVLIVDDQIPELADKIQSAIKGLGGERIDYIVNTHWHFDHADGNTALGPEGATIVAHSNARQDMAEGGIIDMVIAQYQQQPYPADALPELTFKHDMALHFNGGEIELKHFSPAHTSGDAAVFFHRHNAVHMGDVFNNAGYPFVDVGSGGDVDGLIRFCEQTLNAIDEDTIVIPGHGPVTNYETLGNYVAMVRTVRDRIQAMIDEGLSLDEISAAKPTADFDPIYGPEAASLGFVNRVYTDLSRKQPQ